MSDVRIGVSGWTYPPWRGSFYPKGLKQADELNFIARNFNAVEINGTFYGMQVPSSFAAWARQVPAGFCFAVKGPRYLTHWLQLTRFEAPLANFFASGPLALGEKLGPILWQFSARFRPDYAKLDAFLGALPRTHLEAADLGRRHDKRLRARAHLRVKEDRPIRHAIEIRHEGFRDPAFIDLLRRHRVGLVCADTVDWPLLMDLTADFVYCRLHGSTELYRSRYSADEIDRWAARINVWRTGGRMTDGNFVLPPLDDKLARDVYVFFDNTDKLQAPGNAAELMHRLGVAPPGATRSTVGD